MSHTEKNTTCPDTLDRAHGQNIIHLLYILVEKVP